MTFLLDTPLRNWRGHTESFEAYRARLRKMHGLIKRRLKGKLAHVSATIFSLPYDLKDDEEVNALIQQGKIRGHKVITLPDGGQMRVGINKGTTYRRPLKEVKFK